jgi:hypothetical protein
MAQRFWMRGWAAAAVVLIAGMMAAENDAPNPYRVVDESSGDLPAGRTYGATSAVFPSKERASTRGVTSTAPRWDRER